MGTADVVTASIAGAALALSIVGLVVQWVMWSRSGAVIVPEARSGLLMSGPTNRVLIVTAMNKGRGSAQVTTWWLEPVGAPPDALHWVLLHLQVGGSSPLPAMIDGEHEVRWFVPLEAVEDSCREKNVTHVRPCLSLGSGRKVAGKPLQIL